MATGKPKKAQKQLKVLKAQVAQDKKVIKQATKDAKGAIVRAKKVAKGVKKQADETEQKLKTRVKNVVRQAKKKIAAVEKKKVKIKKVVKVVRKKGMGTYQYFMRQQLRDGKTFEQAARAWKKFKLYVKRGKIPTRTVTVMSKPTIVTRTRFKTRPVVKPPKVITRTKIKRVLVPQPAPSSGMFKDLMNELRDVKRQMATEKPAPKPVAGPGPPQPQLAAAVQPSGITEEAQAFELVKLYLGDVAQHGLKRQLDLDQVINAYFYALGRICRKEIEIREVGDAVHRHG